MRGTRSFVVLLAVTVVMVAAALYSIQTDNRDPVRRSVHYTELGDRISEIRSVEIRTAAQELRLVRTEEGWVAADRGNYPADNARVTQLVLGISRLQRLERKTGDPEKLQRLDLQNIDQPGSGAVEVALLENAGQELVRILVGKTDEFQASGRSRYFIRDAGDPQSWLVEGTLPPVLDNMSDWLQREIFPGLVEQDVQRVSAAYDDGEMVSIQRDGPDADFRLLGLSGKEEIREQYAINAVAKSIPGISLKDVVETATDAGQAVAKVEVRTFSGARLEVEVFGGDPDYQLRPQAAYEPSKDAAGSRQGRELVAALEQRWRGRAFVVSQYALDRLLVRRQDLLKPADGSAASQ